VARVEKTICDWCEKEIAQYSNITTLFLPRPIRNFILKKIRAAGKRRYRTELCDGCSEAYYKFVWSRRDLQGEEKTHG